MKLGPIRFQPDILMTQNQLTWMEDLTILGVYFSPDRTKMINENYNKLLNKVKAITTVWSSRSLTIIGKILLVNTLLMSQFIYKLLSMYSPPPTRNSKAIQKNNPTVYMG